MAIGCQGSARMAWPSLWTRMLRPVDYLAVAPLSIDGVWAARGGASSPQ